MCTKILIAYASMTGATAGTAEAIGQVLAEGGAQIEVCPMAAVQDLTNYRAVVAGSAIHDGKWLPEAMEFLRMHQAALARRPFAAFLVCMTMSVRKGLYQENIASWMEPVRALVKPVSEGYFAGVLDIGKIPSFRNRVMFRLSIASGVWSEGDHRDWDAIRTWAASLSPLLES